MTDSDNARRGTSGGRRLTGVLLVNLGTPDDPGVPAVRRYLREFLGDPRVIDIPAWKRSLVLELAILPFRPKQTAHAYRQIWTAEGSPLMTASVALQRGVAEALGPEFVVELAMRYQSPSIPSALARLQAADVGRLVVLPLFPQYAAATNGSVLARVFELLGAGWNVPAVETIDAFYDDPRFIAAFADVARPQLDAFRPDHVLFSYHGIPERHVRKSDPSGRHCLTAPGCCDRIDERNRFCYRAHCFATTRLLGRALGLQMGRHSNAFQSRLGRDPWLEPYTDLVLPELAAKGVKRLAILCPAFVADCLETLEEIGLRGAEQWRAEGGEELLLVRSLNAEPAWIQAVADMVREPRNARG